MVVAVGEVLSDLGDVVGVRHRVAVAVAVVEKLVLSE